MSITKHLLAVAVGACLAASASAQESLIDIYNRALQADPAIREAEATYLSQSEVKPQARAALLPSVNLNAQRRNIHSDSPGGSDIGGGIGVGSRTITDQNQQSWSVGLTQTLFNWSNYATLRGADKRVARAETDFEAAKQGLMVRVSQRYFDVLAAEDNLSSASAAREAVSRQLEQANRRFEVGLIAITDVQQSQAGYDDAVAVEIEAQRGVASAHESLREIIGEIVMDLAAPTDDAPLLSPDPPNPEQWVQTALQQNLALVSSRLATEVALEDIDVARGSRLPTLSLTAGYSNARNDSTTEVFDNILGNSIRPINTEPEGRNWSLDLRFPIYTGGLNKSRINQSVYNHRVASEALERISRQTERQTRDAYLSVISNVARVRALRQSVESNRTALRATEAGFEVGTQTTVDVLTAQQLLRRAETSYSQSRYQYILNVLLLKQAAGTLSAADLQEVDGWLQQ
ncbi:MAG TPA: TolC family outer membrane protein [Gammaproteobacteria bacterium]|jgi:outer membrane protein|nr:TolC family outer membrane protein [Gammaproteobacteria bacterium]